jgi:hypothetical protein
VEIDDYCVLLSLCCIEAAEAQDVGADPKRVGLSNVGPVRECYVSMHK